VADLSYRFDTYTENHYGHQLARLRELATGLELPSRLSVEIGSNRANFLAGLSERRPERFHVGLEWRKKYVDLGHRMFQRRGIENALLLQADANFAMPILFDDGQIEEVFILFPDPWWKKRHYKRRVIQPDFLDLMHRKMSSGGILWIRTDVGPLADDMRDTLDAHKSFEPLKFDEFPSHPFPRTTREVKIIDQGLPINLLYYRRV